MLDKTNSSYSDTRKSGMQKNAQLDQSSFIHIVGKVPDEAIISPKRFGLLKMVGYYIPPDCRTITKRQPLTVETYWTIEEPLDGDCRLEMKAVPLRECRVEPYKGTERVILDSEYPVKFWRPGVIYYDIYKLNPPLMNKLANIDLQMELKVIIDGIVVNEFKDPDLIKVRIPELPCYKTEFDDIIYQSKPGICWTAEQLAAVTGGEWIVPPPKGWYVQSFSRLDSLVYLMMPAPSMFVATTIHDRDTHSRILENIDKLAGAMVTHEVEGLPPDFPLLKVANTATAIWDVALAAKKRFKGKVISVTGASGKTTTCNMLNCVLGKNHNVFMTPNNINTLEAWVFAHVKQDDAYTIMEIASNAFRKSRGSISYDIPPDVAVVTLIAPAHLSNFGTLKGVALCKRKILCGMKPGSYAVLNRDMPYYELFEEKAKSLKLNIITFGKHPDAFVRMPVIENGGKFEVMGKTYTLSCPVPAEQLCDALAVIGVTSALGIPVEYTLEALKTFKIVKGRGNVLKINRRGKNLTVIDSTFNANPASLGSALKHLKNVEPNQKSRVAILGDIAELGKQSVELHKKLAPVMLDAEPDRLLLCGKFMRYPYEIIKDQLNCTWFATLDELIKSVDEHLQDGDTVLVKSSHDTGLSRVVAFLNRNTPQAAPSVPKSNVPVPLFDVKDFLPIGITAEQNGRMPAYELKRIHCGGQLYIDAARSWLAMVRAAAQDNIFLNLNYPSLAYRSIERQRTLFNQRFIPVEEQENLSADAIRVEFDGKLWQLKPNAVYAAIPGQSSHGYGLSVDIENASLNPVKNWLNENAEQFGFVNEYDFEPWHFTYIKSREELPARVLEIESLPPEPSYSAEEIQFVCDGEWIISPPEDWTCNGIIFAEMFQAGNLVVVDQGAGIGMSEQRIRTIFRQAAGFICTNPTSLVRFNRPILVVSNIKETMERISELFKPC